MVLLYYIRPCLVAVGWEEGSVLSLATEDGR